MKKILLPLLIVAATLSGCASTEEFKEGSKILGGLLWESAPRTETTCVTGTFGSECISYAVPNDRLTPEQEAKIEAKVTAEYLEEKRQKAQAAEEQPTI